MENKVQKVLFKNRLVIIWMAFFILNAIVALKLKVITMIPDELNPLGLPAYLSGLDWSTSISNYKNYYGYGQAIFYTPFFMFIKNNILLYKVIILFNSFIVSFIPIIAYKMLKKFFDIKNEKLMIMIACVAGAQPCYFTLSKRAWNETLIMFLIWIVCYLLLKCLNSKNRRGNIIYSILLSFSLVYGYATHGRFVAIIIAVIFTLILFYILTKRKIIAFIPFVASTAVLFYIDNLIKAFLLKNIWLIENESELRNTLAETIGRVITNILSIDTFYVYLRALSGYIFYISVASLGMVFLGIVLYCNVFKNIYKNRKTIKPLDTQTLAYGIFLICSLICALGIAIIFFTTELLASHEYYFIYGRYTEYLIGPIILFTFVLLNKYEVSLKNYIITGIIYLFHCIYTFLVEAADITSPNYIVGPQNILTLESFSFNYCIQNSKLAFLSAIVVSIVCFFIIVYLLYKKKYTIVYSFIICVFLFSYCRTSYNLLISDSYGAYKSIESTYNFFNNIELDNNYKKVNLLKIFPHIYQLALKDFEFQPISDENYKIQKNTFIVTNNDYKLINDYKELYEIVLNNKQNNERLFVYGDELADNLSNQGVEFSSNEYSLGEKIRFSNLYSLDKISRKGWYAQEDWGMWSEYPLCELGFLLNEEPKDDLIVELELNAFNNLKKVEFYVNENFISTITVKNSVSTYKVKIPHEFMYNSKFVNLSFKITDELLSPKDLGMSEDIRKLGIGIYSIIIK